MKDDVGAIVLMVFVLPLAIGMLGKASDRVLGLLVGWKVLVANPVVELPGTGVGLDVARLVVVGGLLLALLVAARGRRS